ncbi:TPA: shugoshin-like 2 [Bos taurus]|nr:TPA: shugoshin-like 2 [Bos taurus]
MEYPAMETSSLFTSGIKKHVKDRRISKTTKLNVSLASKIKTKIINNSSIFKISLKHNNRALALALSRERENSRRITTEKMLLQKEVDKLNFENTFLRLKLNNLNKKLIEIEALMNNNLITAIEMSALSELGVPLTSNDDDDEDKEKIQCDDITISKTSPDSPSLVSARPVSTQNNLRLLFVKENDQNVCSVNDSEHVSSIVDTLPKGNHSHSDQSSRSSLTSEKKNAQAISHKKEKSSPSNVTKRKKRVSSWESDNPADTPCVTDLDQQQVSSPILNWNNEIKDYTNETNTMQRNILCLPASSESASEPPTKGMNPLQGNDFQLQKTVYDDDMDLTASEVSKIITVSTGTKKKRKKNSDDCGMKTFRKVKDPSSEKKRERSKRQFKNCSGANIEEKIESGPEDRSVDLDGEGDSRDPNFIFSTEQLTQLNTWKKITLPNGFDQGDKQSMQCNQKKKRIHVTDEQEETYSFSQSSDKFPQDSKFDLCPSSLTCKKSKASRQTFVIHTLEKDNLFPNQKVQETTSENLGVTNEFQTAYLSNKGNPKLCDDETQNMFDLKKHVTDTQPTQQNESKINKDWQKINRKTEIISKMNQILGDNTKDVQGPEKGNFSFQTQEDKETISRNLDVSNEFQKSVLSTVNNGNLCDCETQNVLGLQKQITYAYPVQQNESRINKTLKQKVNRKTEIISTVNHLDNTSEYCPEKGKEIIPENPLDTHEFQTPTLSSKDSRDLYDYDTQNVLGLKMNVHDIQPACQNESKIDKLRQKVCRKTKIISEVNQIYMSDDKGRHDPEKGNFFSLTPNNEETIAENLKVTHEFQTIYLSTKDDGHLYDYKTQNMLDLTKHVTDKQPTRQNESKINKNLKQKQKVNRKTEIISEMCQIYEVNDKDVHGQESYTKNLDFKINKQRPEGQAVSGYCMEINSDEKENCDEISNPYKPIKKHGKESDKAKNILAKSDNMPVLQLTGSSQMSVLNLGLKHITDEADSDTGNHMEPHRSPKLSTKTLNRKRKSHFVEVTKEGECQVKKVNKMTSKSKKRKTFEDPSLDSHELVEMMSDTIQEVPVEPEYTVKGKKLENVETVKIKPDFYTKMLIPLSQMYSPSRQDSSRNSVLEGSVPLSISSNKNLKENFAPESSPIFQLSDEVHEKMKDMKFKVDQRPQRSEIGVRMLQDLTNTSFVSNTAAKFENKVEDLSSELPSRRRRCTPLSLKEPSLKGKMRR